MNRAEVAVAMKQRLQRSVDPSTIWKIENATINPSSDMLSALLEVLQGSAAIVQSLFQRDDASREDGQKIGRQMASSEFSFLTEESAELLRRLTPEQRREAINRLRQMLQES